MRGIPVVVALLASAPFLHAEPQTLTQADREQLLEKIQKIQDAADAKVDERFRAAVSAYRSALANDGAVMEFYLKCIEKIQFTDQHKTAQEFREYARREEGKLKDPGFRCALRHQLQWLVLTLQVASSKKPNTAFAAEGMRAIDEVFTDIDKLEAYHGVLRQSAMNSVFAQIYDLGSAGVNPGDWPGSPLELRAFYDKIMLPPLRKPDKIDALRAGWMKRIQQQRVMAEKWSRPGDGDARKPKDTVRAPDYDKFLEDTYPTLLWEMEVDVFTAGGQREAALHMFQHLEKFANNPKASDWARQFKDMLAAPPTAAPATGGTTGTAPATTKVTAPDPAPDE